MNRSLFVSMWAVAALLAACGGGGGSEGGGPPPPPAPPPVQPPGTFNVNAAWRNFLTVKPTAPWSLSGVGSDNRSYTITLDVAPTSSSTFPLNGLIYAATDATAVIGIAGLGLNQTISRTYYDPATLKAAGTRTTTINNVVSCSIVTATAVPPLSAVVGESGPMQTFDDRQTCAPASASVGTSTTTWSLETETGTNYFCLNTTIKDLAGTVAKTESDCLEVSESGALGAKARIILVEPDLTLTARTP